MTYVRLVTSAVGTYLLQADDASRMIVGNDAMPMAFD